MLTLYKVYVIIRYSETNRERYDYDKRRHPEPRVDPKQVGPGPQ